MSTVSIAETGSRPSPWNDPKIRAIVFQAIVLVAVVLAVWSIVENTAENLARQKIASGFGFLSTSAGFDISVHLIPYTPEHSYGRAFLVGVLNTLLVASIGVVIATVLGFIIGIARLSPNWLVAKFAAAYIEILRNVPLLLQLFFWYFAILSAMPHPRDSIEFGADIFLNIRGLSVPRPIFEPGFWLILLAFGVAVITIVALARWARRRLDATGQPFPIVAVGLAILVGLPLLAAVITGFPLSFDAPALKGFNFVGGMVLVPEFTALLIGLSMYTASFIAENVRSGIQAVSHGQTEAALSLGLRRGRTLRLVVIPQAMRVIIPPLTSQYLNLTKNSSLAVAIAYPDLVSVFTGTVLNQTGQAVEVILITMAVYLSFSLTISAGMNWYNRRMRLVER